MSHPALSSGDPVNLVGQPENFSGRVAPFQHVLSLALESNGDFHLRKIEADVLLFFPVEKVFAPKPVN
jgi:hypothetical protein